MGKPARPDEIRRWGTGIFENDADGFTIVDLFDESGVKEGNSTSFLYLGDVDPLKYRKKLDAGVLNKMAKKRFPLTLATFQYDPDSLWLLPLRRCPSYELCLLGAIAMQLGCKLHPNLRMVLEEMPTLAGFSRNAQIQIRHALNVYVDGVPYDFRWKHRPTGLKGDDFATDAIWGDISEILIDAGEESDPKMRLMSRQILGPMLKCTFAGDTEHIIQTCGNCGRKKAKDGSPCRLCSLCNQRLYCSRKCELAHRPKHQLICEDPDYRKVGNIWVKCGDTAGTNDPLKRFNQSVAQVSAKRWAMVYAVNDKLFGSNGQEGASSKKSSAVSSTLDREKSGLDNASKNAGPDRQLSLPLRPGKSTSSSTTSGSSNAGTNSLLDCGNCGTKATPDKALSLCRKCAKQHYCSKKCQKAHWHEHKTRCLTLTSA